MSVLFGCVNCTFAYCARLHRQLDTDALGEHVPPRHVRVRGKLINANSRERFQALDRKALFAAAAQEIWRAICTESALREPEQLCTLLATTFADLKTYRVLYWFACPALVRLVATLCCSTPFDKLFVLLIQLFGLFLFGILCYAARS